MLTALSHCYYDGDFTIYYRFGKTISLADFLSHIYTYKTDASEGGDKEEGSECQELTEIGARFLVLISVRG
jgi:hypothetical protein